MEATELKRHKKQQGSFYSPAPLALYVASRLALYLPPDRPVSVLDPAVGDGELLIAVNAIRKNPEDFYIGVDIDERALRRTSVRLGKNNRLFNTDALHPVISSDTEDGWSAIKKECGIKDFDCIISNPPWGAKISLDRDAISQFHTASGQYDIYDLFIEKSLSLLPDGGVYAFILPDSIFRKEHTSVRKLLLDTTSIKFIGRIGEFFFDSVNTSVSVIVGIKGYSPNNHIECVHYPNAVSKEILANKNSFDKTEQQFLHRCSQDDFIRDSYNFATDVSPDDVRLISQLESLPRVHSFLKSARGVELSKKGTIIQCPSCHKWQPMPLKKDSTHKCCHCSDSFDTAIAVKETIISDTGRPDNNHLPFLSGEDLSRYSYSSRLTIETGKEGINYKDISCYLGPKILVRKTGVGITAVLDYNEHIVTQVVYILKQSPDCPPDLSPEFFIAILNSRVTTYYIIKKFGSSNWCTHPYLSQEMVGSLPVPAYHDFTNTDWEYVTEIENIVRSIYQTRSMNLSPKKDLYLETLIMKLFRLDNQSFKRIMTTISEAEPLVPFKRLLNIPKKKWDIDI